MKKSNKIILEKEIIPGKLMPAPFSTRIDTSLQHVPSLGKLEYINLALTEALAVYIAKGNGLHIYSDTNLAIGSNMIDGGKRVVMVEYQQRPTEKILVRFDGTTLSACVYVEATKRYESLKVGKYPSNRDSTPIWIAILDHLLPTINMNAFLNIDTRLKTSASPLGEESADDLREIFYLLKEECERIEKITTKQLLMDEPPIITQAQLEQKPSDVVFGKFEHFGKQQKTQNASTFNITDYENINSARVPDLFKSFVPKRNKDYVIGKELKSMLSKYKRTRGKKDVLKVQNFLAEGPTGTGKSALMREFCAITGTPYFTVVCSPNLSEDYFSGFMMPYVESGETTEEKEVADACEKFDGLELYNKICQIKGIPDLTECYFSPEGSAEVLSGILGIEKPDNCDAETASQMAITAVINYITTQNANKSEGVSYKFIESPFLIAMKNGFFVEIQEPTLILQEGVLGSLNDVLDRDSTGVLNTVNGVELRHPEFICAITTNTNYNGCKPLNQAVRGRFQHFLNMDTPSREVIIQRLMAKTGCTDTELLSGAAELYLTLDNFVKEEGTTGAVSMRNLFAFVDALSDGDDLKDALDECLISAITTDEETIDELKEAIEDCQLIRDYWK